MRRRAFDPKYSPAQAAAAPVIMYRSRVRGRRHFAASPGYTQRWQVMPGSRRFLALRYWRSAIRSFFNPKRVATWRWQRSGRMSVLTRCADHPVFVRLSSVGQRRYVPECTGMPETNREFGRAGIVEVGYRKQNRQPAVPARTGLVHGFRTGTLFALKTGSKSPSDRIADRSVTLKARDMRRSAADRWHGRKRLSMRNRLMNGR